MLEKQQLTWFRRQKNLVSLLVSGSEDAKYKYNNPAQFMSRVMSADEERDEEERLVYKKGDLYKMHTYRDALGAQAVFVLYPGNELKAYHVGGGTLTTPNDLSEAFEGVGAIPTQVHDPKPLVSCVRWLLMSKSSDEKEHTSSAKSGG